MPGARFFFLKEANLNHSKIQLNRYETAPNSIQLNPKLDIGLFVDLAEFTCFYQFLHDVIIKLFCFDLQNNFMITSCKNSGEFRESTSNPMSSFDLIKENMELPHTD